MSKEFSLSPEMEQRRDRLFNIIGQRESLVGRIGKGEIKEGSSWENTLKVGEARGKVKSSISRLNAELDKIALAQAVPYLDRLRLRDTQLTKMKDMVAAGNLSKDTLSAFELEYAKLVSCPANNPFLKRGIEQAQLSSQTIGIGDTPVERLELSARALNNLKRRKISTIDQLAAHIQAHGYDRVKNIGPHQWQEIKECLEAYRTKALESGK